MIVDARSFGKDCQLRIDGVLIPVLQMLESINNQIYHLILADLFRGHVLPLQVRACFQIRSVPERVETSWANVGPQPQSPFDELPNSSPENCFIESGRATFRSRGSQEEDDNSRILITANNVLLDVSCHCSCK